MESCVHPDTYIIEKIHHTAEAQDEKVKFLYQRPLAWHTLSRSEIILQTSRKCHLVVVVYIIAQIARLGGVLGHPYGDAVRQNIISSDTLIGKIHHLACDL